MIGLDLSPRQGQRTGAPLPLATFFAAGGGQSVALAEGAGDNLSVWTEIGPNHAAWMRFDGTNAATRYSWRETLVMELRNIYAVGEMALLGSWSRLQSSGSGMSGSYTGNRAVSTSSLTASASVTVDRATPYDVWIHFTGRTNGGYCRVDIDGAQSLVNELDDPAGLGFKAFSTYSDVDLQRRQSVKVASGLTGAHDITFACGGAATPGGNVILIEAVAISGALTDPRILPPLWQPETTYEMGDEVQFGGIFYSARGDGPSGTNGPTHAGGIASDGALDWRADDRPTYPVFVAVDYPSEREYAARIDVGGTATEIGGQTHGNEALQSRVITLDGQTWVPATSGNGLSVGNQIEFVETMQWQTGSGTPVADCQLTRSITPGVLAHVTTLTGLGPVATFEWFYAGMVPMVGWDGESRSSVVTTLELPGSAPVVFADYEGINPPNLNFADAQRIGLTAPLDAGTLIYGHEAGALAVSGNVVNQFDTFLRPNLNATVSGGSLDWQAKAYVTGSADGGLTLGDGDTLGFFSRHVLRLTPPSP
jgi:hypothetical protein